MSAQPTYAGPLRAERGGLAPANLPDLPRPRMTPAEIPLTLSADVLRLKCTMNARAVLAEIVSLYAATGLCDASDSHFAARLSISLDTASRAVKELEAEGLVEKVTARVAKVLYRTLTPKPEAIAEKSAANPYPQNQGRVPAKSGYPYPQNQGTGTRNLPVGVPAKSVSNTPSNIPSNFQVNPTPSADASELADEKKIEEEILPAALPANEVEIVPPVARSPRARATKTKPGEPPGFAELYECWPKHVSRDDAARAFAKLPPDDQAAALPRAQAWIAASPNVGRDNNRYVPNLATWLNNARWTDSFPALATSTHATANSTNAAPRPAGGAKPTSNATELAGALASRRFRQ